MPPKKGKKGGKKQDDDWGEDDKKVIFLALQGCDSFLIFYHLFESFSGGRENGKPADCWR